MIASHYAQPVPRRLLAATALLSGPAEDSDVIRQLAEGDVFALLDDSVGWAWGYAGEDRRVGYVKSDALGA